ncbi:hypothetical protein J7M07_02710 [bacterium]|nr:hypothetical protein [bacterium]
MAKRGSILLLAIMIILPSWSMAADGIMEKIEFNANAGLSMPIGDAGDFYNIGICLGIDGLFPIKTIFSWEEELRTTGGETTLTGQDQ